MSEQPVLCYVDGAWAWFTTAPLDVQWGDDWNDAPYEDNAGEPYEWMEHRGDPYTLLKLAFDGPFWQASDARGGPYSVEQINNGRFVPWLVEQYVTTGEPVQIWAGTPIRQFVTEIDRAGGHVWVPLDGVPWLANR